MQRLAEKEANHSVSGWKRKGSGSNWNRTKRSLLEAAGFEVTNERPDGHVDIIVPNPVTQEDALKWNRVWGHIK
jgi:hypothetical protein